MADKLGTAWTQRRPNGRSYIPFFASKIGCHPSNDRPQNIKPITPPTAVNIGDDPSHGVEQETPLAVGQFDQKPCIRHIRNKGIGVFGSFWVDGLT